MARLFRLASGQARLLTAGVAAPLMALRQSGRCAEIVDEAEEFGEFMKLANVPASYQLDFARVNAGTVKELMTYDGGKLNSERPDMPTVHALLAAAAVGSALVVPNDIPLIDHKKADASADTVRRAEYVTLTSNFQVLCQMARVHFPNVIARTVARAVPPAANVPSSDDQRLKDSAALAARLVQAAERTYNIRFIGGRRASAKQLCKTRIALERGTIDVARLDSGEYGRLSFVDKEAPALGLSGDGAVRELPEGEVLTRIAMTLAVVNAVLDSFVIAGLVEIDPAKQTHAGPYGSLADGKKYQFDMTTGRVLKAAYLSLADCLPPKRLIDHFQETLMPYLGLQMGDGHSLCSAAMAAVHTAAWMRPEGFASGFGRAVPTTSSAPGASQSGEKEKKRIKALEAQVEQMKAAKDRREREQRERSGQARGGGPFRRDRWADEDVDRGRGRGGRERDYYSRDERDARDPHAGNGRRDRRPDRDADRD